MTCVDIVKIVDDIGLKAGLNGKRLEENKNKKLRAKDSKLKTQSDSW